jgi:hypothetical protein
MFALDEWASHLGMKLLILALPYESEAMAILILI